MLTYTNVNKLQIAFNMSRIGKVLRGLSH